MKKTCGSAFPLPRGIDTTNQTSGMTLRDYFAGQALVGILSFPGTIEGESIKNPDKVSRICYVFADAMIAERDKE